MPLIPVSSRPRFGCYSPLLTEVYWGLLVPSVVSVSIWLPVSSVLSVENHIDIGLLRVADPGELGKFKDSKH
jgi:hypothetical protein